MKVYEKPRYDLPTLVKDVLHVGLRLPRLIQAEFAKRIDSAFREKIMLAVTNVNDCRYCRFVHTMLARALGVSEDEIVSIWNNELRGVDEYQRVAIEYARHYTESKRRPSAEMERRLEDFYGRDKAHDIRLYIRAILIGNLTGNTFDALLGRMKGQRIMQGNLLFELWLSSLVWPVLLPQTILINARRRLNPAA